MRDRPATPFLKFGLSLVVLSGLVTLALPGARQGVSAQSSEDASRPWPCWAQSVAAHSLLRPISLDASCHSSAATIHLAPSGTLQTIRPLVVPGTPTSLVATVTGRAVTLTWAPAAGDPATSYVLEAGSAVGLSDLANADTGSPRATLAATDVPPGTYVMRVRTRSAAGTSAPSNEVLVNVAGACSTVPGAPTGLTASVNGSFVTLTWQAPSGDCAPTSYVIEAGSGSGLSNLASFSTGTTATTFATAGVGAGTYFVRLRSANGTGTSAPSNEIQVTVGGCSAPPAAPTGFTSQVSGTSVSLSWTGASESPTGYVIEAGSSPGSSNLAVLDTGSPATSLTATAGAGTYYVRLRARNSCGTSGSSAEIIVIVTGAPPGPLTWVQEATLLNEVTAGFPGQSISNTAAFQLRDGRWRILFNVYSDSASSVRSAISPDGINLTMESGVRIDTSAALGPTSRVGGIKVLRLDDGRLRAYFWSVGGIHSAVSSDEGVTFTVENGVRFAPSAVGETASLTAGSVVRIGDGRWRMYLGASGTGRVFSLTSTDLLTWTLEAGIRLGPGSQLSLEAGHPGAILNADGSVTLFYFHGSTPTNRFPRLNGIFESTASDGLTFTTETATGIALGNDPDVVPLPGGGYRMYYDWGNDFNGTFYSARSR